MPVRDQKMQCPRCGTQLTRYADRAKWRCKACLGALVGADELEVEIGPHARAILDEPADPTRPAIHPCPACAYPMTPYVLHGVELDRCTSDSLAWFDGGEIGRVRASIPAEEDSPLIAATAGFLDGLREQSRAEEPAVFPELPRDTSIPPTDAEWAARRLCWDGRCTGLVVDGTCNLCGKRSATPAARCRCRTVDGIPRWRDRWR